jgi:hypothetical protein
MNMRCSRLVATAPDNQTVNDAEEWLTVREYMEKYEPKLLRIYIDEEESLDADIAQAIQFAHEMHIQCQFRVDFKSQSLDMEPALPEYIWSKVYT